MNTTTPKQIGCIGVVVASLLLMVFVAAMHHGQYGPWLWMLFPIFLLTLNLIWPRSQHLKIVGLVLLVLAAWLPDLNPLDRVINLAERILKGEQTGTPEQIMSNLRIAQGWAHDTLYYVKLGFTAAVVFALVPADVISRFCSRRVAPNKSLQATAAAPSSCD
jgi:hypothetical protein